MRRNRILFPVLLLALLLASCPAQSDSSVSSETNMRPRARSVVLDTASSDSGGLKLRLSEGAAQPQSGAPVVIAPAVSLSSAETQQVLDRLPALPAEAGDIQEFALPKESLPPPRPGQTVEASFPPSTTAKAPQQPVAGPLEVVRTAPQGDVALAPYLNLTFSQPMVALTAHEDLAAQGVPASLSPAVAGAWRWVGTQTLMFEPRAAPGAGSSRFPMATQYTVTVPATTTSATGGKLAEAVTWTFTTPPPQLSASYPTGGPYRLDPLLFAAFDQQIDPEAVLSTIQVKAGALAPALRLATADEIKADAAVSQMSANAGEKRWLAFRTVAPLPAGTNVTVTIGPGTPSAEGPRKTTAAQSFSFSTYSPLVVQEARCSWGGNCAPLTPWFIQFNNPLDAGAFQNAQVAIEPELPGARIEVYGSSLSIQGNSQGRTTYQVTLDAGLKDQFGQTLGRAQILTFKVGSASPAITVQGNGFVVLDPTARPALSVFTLNYSRLNVQLYKVRPEDWPAYRTWVQTYYQTQSPSAPPGEQVLSKTIQISAKADELVETAVDLSPALQDGLGQVIAVIDPQPRPANEQRQLIQSWVQSSRIGLDAFVDPTQMVAWANSLLDGSPLPGVELSLLPNGKAATTGEDGLATLSLPDAAGAGLLVATKGGDTAILPQNTYWWGDGGWQRRLQSDSLRWAVFDDRGMYRPGEEVHVKGWIRRVGGGVDGDVAALNSAVGQVSYRLQDPQGNEVRNGLAKVDALGGFDLALTLPEAMNLGPAMLTLQAMGSGLDGYTYNHSFQVQEFRRPEFEVSASASEGPHIVGGHAIASVEAKYYAGGGLADAEVTWQVSTSTAHYSPPGWDEFSFGVWTPWWGDWMKPYEPQSPPVTFIGRTDASGKHQLRIDFDSMETPQPASVSAQATVMDVNRQAWTAQTTLLVHPADLYVGLRSDRIFVQREDPLRVDAIVVDLDGKPVADRRISMKAARLDWQYKNGSWQEVEAAVQPCTVVSTQEPVQCTFETPEGGTYRITATIEDEQGRANQSQITRWVSGSSRPPARQVEQEQVTLIPDRKEYRPGDTAQILVQAPFYPAEGVLTLRRSGIVSSERFTMTGPTYTASVPIKDAYTPNVYVQIDLVGAAPRLDDAGNVVDSLPKRPAFATGNLDLSVPPLSRTLNLEVTPRDKALEPGGKTTVDVLLKDAEGKPVAGGEVAVVVVDEAVLALTGYTLPDPMAVFYSQRSPDTDDYHLRDNVLLANPDLLQPQIVQEAAMDMALPAAAPAATSAPAAAMAPRAMAKSAENAYGGAAEAAPQIAVRTDFNALATFAPALPTDAQGRAQVEVKLPDNLTRYRIMAVAVAGGKQFGAGESTITARLPLMVRASPPRFLNFGDKFELPIVLQNQTDADIQVDVAVTATNVALTAGQGRRVTVPANDRVEVRFPATTERPGTARFQVGAVAGKWADAAQFELPVWTPATTEAFATYGQIDEGAIAQPVIAPTDVYTQFGGLEITTSSTALQALTDAVLYLVSYPFECSEQLASRVMAVAALRDVLTAFKAEGLPAPDEIQAAMTRDIERLHGLQNDDGGFGFWRRGDESWPYLSIHVAHALQRARRQGLRGARRHAAALAGLPARHRAAHPVLVWRRRPPLAHRLRAVRAQPDGRQGHHPRPPAHPGSRVGETALRNSGLAALRADGRSPVKRRGGRHPALSQQPGHRDGRRSQLCDLVWRRRVPAAAHESPHRRRDPGCLDGRPAAERPDPQAGAGVAGASHQGPLGQHPGECLRSAGAGSLLQHLRGPDARFRGTAVARRPVRRGGHVPGPQHRPATGRHPDGGRGKHSRDTEPDPEQRRHGAALLPAGHVLRAQRPVPGAGRPRLHGRTHLRSHRRSG